MSRVLLPNDPRNPEPPIPGIIGSSPAMREVYWRVRKVAPTRASVLILGETGTGKELIAQAIHQLSDRQNNPFVKVNCGALPESLLESELFGHVKGAFTGAVANRTGRFEAAHTGSIFLDEINSTSLQLQVKLLRVLQQGEFERVGDTHTMHTDVRVIAASNRELLEEIDDGRFREDLYYRLNVVPIPLPPLRARREDISELVHHFLTLYNEENDSYVVHIEPTAMEVLRNHPWPGNIRELQNYVQRAVVLAQSDTLTKELLEQVVFGTRTSGFRRRGQDLPSLIEELVETAVNSTKADATDLKKRVVDQVERELIAQVMDRCKGTKVQAAKMLGINRNTLHKKLEEYHLEEPGSATNNTAEQPSGNSTAKNPEWTGS